MASFAETYMGNFGWIQGKGLGKNENGITEPVKLVANKNKTGIGYDDIKPWWETMYDEAAKNVKVESHGDRVTLSCIDKNKDYSRIPLRGNEIYQNTGKTALECIANSTCPSEFNWVPENLICEKKSKESSQEMEEITEDDIALNEKLKRNEPYNYLHSYKPLFNTASTRQEQEHMTYRKTNVQTDTEESEHETKKDNDKSTLQYQEECLSSYVNCKSAKKKSMKHRRRINKLVEQLNTCTLQEDNKTVSLCTKKKFYQKMKKSKVKRIDSSLVLHCINYEKAQLEQLISEYDGFSPNALVNQSRILFGTKGQFLNTVNVLSNLVKYENENNNVNHQIKSLELKNSAKETKTKVDTDKFYKDYVCIKLEETEKQQKDVNRAMVPTCSSNFIPRTSRFNKKCYDSIFLHRLNRKDNIQTKPQKCCRLKQAIESSSRIQKIAEELKGEALSNELNSVIKKIIAIELAEKVDANTIKKKTTQTHLTPV